jgi:putative FmdB family regulatory protein
MLLTVVESKVKIARCAGAEQRNTHPFSCRCWLVFCSFWRRIATIRGLRRALMPTYEYSCEKCGKTFETFQSMRDEPLRECPKALCRQKKWGHGKVKRLLGTGAGLIFKGSGFYITDYRSNSYKEGAKNDAPAAPAVSGEKSSGAKEGGGIITASAPAKAPEPKPKKQSTK